MGNCKQVYSGIGGQAVLEGIMMKNKEDYAVAVRKPDGMIAVQKESYESFDKKHPWAKLPFIRGIFSFVDSLVLGMKTIMLSASFSEGQEKSDREDPSENKEGVKDAASENAGKGKEKNDKKGEKGNDGELTKGEMTITVLLAVVIAVGVFMVLPTVVVNFLKPLIPSEVLLALIEGLFRIGLFIAYVCAISLMPDIKRTYMYHGAEHKCINCVEHGLPMTVENVMKSSKEHKRCGTSFLIIVLVISVVLFMFLHFDNMLFRVLSRIVLIPVIAGISYEILRVTGRFENKLVYIITRPGMWMQALTTKEPTADMAEVAIKATEEVFDWRAFLRENFPENVYEECVSEENSVENVYEECVSEENSVENAPANDEKREEASDKS